MKRYVVRHQHPADRCPARQPEMAAMLLAHLRPERARTFGVEIEAEGVIDGQHTLYLIVRAEDRTRLEEYLQPFAQAGTVDIWTASSCEEVVQRQSC